MTKHSFEALKASCNLLTITKLQEETFKFFFPNDQIKEIRLVIITKFEIRKLLLQISKWVFANFNQYFLKPSKT